MGTLDYKVTAGSTFHNLHIALNEAGISNDEIMKLVYAYCAAEKDAPREKKTIYKEAFFGVLNQWNARLVKYGDVKPEELAGLYNVFFESLRENTSDALPDATKTAVSALGRLYASLRIRGFSHKEICKSTEDLASRVIEHKNDSTELGFEGYDNVVSLDSFESLLIPFYRRDIDDDGIRHIVELFRAEIAPNDKINKELWISAFYGVLIQWMYKLSQDRTLFSGNDLTESFAEYLKNMQLAISARNVKKQAKQALDSYVAYMRVSGIGDEEIEAAVKEEMA